VNTRRASIDPTTVTAEEIAAFGKPGRRRSIAPSPEPSQARRRGSTAPGLPISPKPQERKGNTTPPKRHPGHPGAPQSRRGSMAGVNVEEKLLMEKEAQERIAEAHQTFALFDKDGDGSITTVELALVLRSLGQAVSQEEVQDMMNEVDIDGNGELDFGEFLQLMSKFDRQHAEQPDPTEEYKYAFALFDQNGDGLITADEFRDVMANLDEPMTREEVVELISQVDMDGDGQIDYIEFSRLMMARCED
jgi:calmodulin